MDIDQVKLAKLARERVMNLKPLDDILNVFELSKKQFAEIEAMPAYQRIVEHYAIEWNSALSTPDRVKLRSATTVEDNMDILSTRMVDPTTPLTASVETMKLFAKLAGLGEKKDEMPSSEKFIININLGENKTVTYSPAEKLTDEILDLPALPK